MLTRKLTQTYNFIQEFMREHRYAPTMAEIAEGIGIKSRGVVHRYVQSLAEEGLLSIIPGKRRNIRLIEQGSNTAIPVMGYIAAGRPIEAATAPETIDIAYTLTGSERYALRVKGDSMIEEGIFEGDLVICEYAETANNGDIVVALVDNETVTLKQFYYAYNGTVTLKPANCTMQPMNYSAERVKIQGIMVGLLRLVV